MRASHWCENLNKKGHFHATIVVVIERAGKIESKLIAAEFSLIKRVETRSFQTPSDCMGVLSCTSAE